MSDLDNDGSLIRDEFCLALYLVQRKLDGKELPKELPSFLIPSSTQEDEQEGDEE